MTTPEVVTKLIEICNKGQFEQTLDVFLKNAIHVGNNPQGPVYAVSIDRAFNPIYDVDHLVVHVIFDEKDDDLYGRDTDFASVSFKSENDLKPTFIKGMSDDELESEDGIVLFPNALDLILAELESSGDEWIEEQRQLRIRQRFFHRNAIYAHEERFKEHYKELSWEEQMERSQVNGEIEWLMYRRPREKNFDFKTLAEMKELGEEAYKAKLERQNEEMRRIMTDWDPTK